MPHFAIISCNVNGETFIENHELKCTDNSLISETNKLLSNLNNNKENKIYTLIDIKNK